MPLNISAIGLEKRTAVVDAYETVASPNTLFGRLEKKASALICCQLFEYRKRGLSRRKKRFDNRNYFVFTGKLSNLVERELNLRHRLPHPWFEFLKVRLR